MHDIHVERLSRRLGCGAKVTIYREIVSVPDEDYDDFLDREYSEEN